MAAPIAGAGPRPAARFSPRTAPVRPGRPRPACPPPPARAPYADEPRCAARRRRWPPRGGPRIERGRAEGDVEEAEIGRRPGVTRRSGPPGCSGGPRKRSRAAAGSNPRSDPTGAPLAARRSIAARMATQGSSGPNGASVLPPPPPRRPATRHTGRGRAGRRARPRRRYASPLAAMKAGWVTTVKGQLRAGRPRPRGGPPTHVRHGRRGYCPRPARRPGRGGVRPG